MFLFEEKRLASLIAIALEHFGPDLTEGELDVLRYSASLTRPEEPKPSLNPDLDQNTPLNEISTARQRAKDPPHNSSEKIRPMVRPEFLRWLLTAAEVQPHIDPQGVHVHYAAIPGSIDLRRAHLLTNLYVVDSIFDGKLRLNGAQAQDIILYHCVIPGFEADSLHTRGPLFILKSKCSGTLNLQGSNLGNALICSGTKLTSRDSKLNLEGAIVQGNIYLTDGFESAGEVIGYRLTVRGNLSCNRARLRHPETALDLGGANIDGALLLADAEIPEGSIRLVKTEIGSDFDCSGCHIGNSQGEFTFDGASIGGVVILGAGFETARPVRCIGARLGSDLNCSAGKFLHPDLALDFGSAKIVGAVGFFGGFEAAGEIAGTWASIGGDLDCTDAKFTNAKKALTFYGSAIRGDVYLSKGFVAHGEINFVAALISGYFVCSGAKLMGREISLNLALSTIEGNVDLDKGFEALGQVRMAASKMIRDLDCSDAKFRGADIALNCERLVVEGCVFLQRSETNGEVIFRNARIGIDFSCKGAKLNGNASNSLNLIDAIVQRNIYLSDGCTAKQTVTLGGAIIKGSIFCNGGNISVLYGEGMRVTGTFLWTDIHNPGKCFLFNATIHRIEDDRKSWPPKNSLLLDGLTYNELVLRIPTGAGSPASTIETARVSTDRITWIKRQPREYLREPQPWLQLSKALESAGEKRQARHVLYRFACNEAERHAPPLLIIKRSYAWLVEQPFRICWSITLILLLGTALFTNAAVAGAMRPTNKDAADAWAHGKPMPNAYPKFNSLIYTLENELPLVKLGMDDRWAPDQNFNAEDFGKSQHYPYWRTLAVSYLGLSIARWILILVGWIQATVLAASVGSRFRSL